MSRLLATALTAILLFAAVPAAFGDELGLADAAGADGVGGCDNPEALDVIGPEGLLTDIALPSFTQDAPPESRQFLVDLGSSDATASLDVLMTWGVMVNDFDLEVTTATDSVTSDHTQPLEESAELANVEAITSCEVVTVTASNFLAPVEQDALVLDISFGDAAAAVVQTPSAAAAAPSALGHPETGAQSVPGLDTAPSADDVAPAATEAP